MGETPECTNPACPHRARADALAGRLKDAQAAFTRVARDLARCPMEPGGERCALPAGHEGGCKWDRGD
jgi:hypothetical protein